MNKFAGMIVMMITFIPLTACYQNETKCTNDSIRMIDKRKNDLKISDESVLDIIYTNIIFNINESRDLISYMDDKKRRNNKLRRNSDIVILRDRIPFLIDYCEIHLKNLKYNNNWHRYNGCVGE